MTQPSPSRPGRPRSGEADEAILKAASDLLIEAGIDGAGIDQVARRAGVSRPTVYRRYGDRTELHIAAIHWTFGFRPKEIPEPRDIEELLGWWARSLEAPENERIRSLTLRLMPAGHDQPEFAAVFRELSVEPRNAVIREVLRKEKERGRFPQDTDLEVVRQILAGAVVIHLNTHPKGGTVREAEEFFLAVLHETRFRP